MSESIYKVDMTNKYTNEAVHRYIDAMEVVMIKGVGYMVLAKSAIKRPELICEIGLKIAEEIENKTLK